jgi:hypothetical protein
VSFQIVVRRLAERDIVEAEDWYEIRRAGLGAEFREALIALLERGCWKRARK